MSNIYLERFEERVDQYGLDGVSFNTNDIAILALVKELQTLNETLDKLIQVGPRGDHYISVAVSE